MTDNNTTNINDLPIESSNENHVGQVGGNIGLIVNENNIQPNKPISLDQSSISQIVNGIQQASLSGATQLPSRDIPLRTDQLTNDPQIQVNYIPSSRDYISETDFENNNYKYNTTKSSLDSMYDELQAPILLAVLYFLFQLPFFKKFMFKYLSFLCNSDGNYNLSGLMFVCGLFGFIYYLILKMVKHFSKF